MKRGKNKMLGLIQQSTNNSWVSIKILNYFEWWESGSISKINKEYKEVSFNLYTKFYINNQYESIEAKSFKQNLLY